MDCLPRKSNGLTRSVVSIAGLLLWSQLASAGIFVANLSADPNPNNGDFTMSWDNPTSRLYHLEEMIVGGSSWTVITSTTGTSHPISGKADGDYLYRLKHAFLSCSGFPEPTCYLVVNYSETVPVTVLPESTGGPDPYPAPGPFTPPDDSDFPDAPVVNPFDQYSDTGPSVGALQGNGGVSGGQASYSIPIVVPPGRKGMQPNVSLNYSSSFGNGIAGVGWSLSASSAITRCTATAAQDGFTAAVQYHETRDRLCLDSQRLMVVNGSNYGASGAVYRTELDNFARVTQNGALNGWSTSFTVNYKNNKTSEFGLNPDSRHAADGRNEVLTWAISETRDASGNTITYDYVSYANGQELAGAKEEYLLDVIHYTGINGADGDRRVRFEYELRTDSQSGTDLRTFHRAGGKSRSTQRLKKIVTEYQTTIREYTLDYGDLSASTGRSLLRSVEECAYQNAIRYCLPVTDFSWQEKTPEFVTERLSFFGSGPEVKYEDERWLHNVIPQGDANGDGVKDWTDFKVNAEGQITDTMVTELANCFFHSNFIALRCMNADFNADGLTDGFRNNAGQLQIKMADNDDGPPNNDWQNTGITWATFANASLNDMPLGFADFNGDGWTDLAFKQNDKLILFYHTSIIAAPYSTAPEFAKTVFTYVRDLPDNTRAYKNTASIAGDMDGNGTADIVLSTLPVAYDTPGLPRPYEILLTHSQAGDPIPPVTRLITGLFAASGVNAHFFHDLNGDGLPDLISVTASGQLQYRLNDGIDFIGNWVGLGINLPVRFGEYIPAPGETGIYTMPIMSKILTMDYDGNGIQELLVADSTVLASGCAEITHFVNNLPVTEWLCDDDLYVTYSADKLTQIGTPINADVLDESVRSYTAYRFDEDASGNIVTTSFPSGIVASATQSAAIDATGDGLVDVVTVFGCRNPEPSVCTFNDLTSGMNGTVNGEYLQEGAWINRNLGTATDDPNNSEFEYAAYDLMNAIQDGLGNRHEWVYKPLSSDKYRNEITDSDYYKTANLANEPDYFHFASSMYVVADHRASNGIGGLNSTKYRYRGAIYNNKGRGFQGFLSIITEQDVFADIDPQANTDKITRTDFYQMWPKSSIVNQSCTWIGAGHGWAFDDNPNCNDVISKTTTDSIYEVATTGQLGSPGATVFVAIDGQTEQVNDSASPSLNLTTRTTTRTFDNYGNITTQTEDHSDDYTTNKTETTTVYVPADTGGWWINRVLNRTVKQNPVTARHASSPAIDPGTDLTKEVTSSFTNYDSQHRLPTAIVVTGNDTALSQTVTTVYNARGLPTDLTTIGNGVTGPRTIATTFTNNGTVVGTDGYFPLTVTNSLQHEVKQNTDPAHGQPTSQWDANGLVAVTNYDAFGRVSDITPPGAPTAYQRYFWCGGGTTCPAGAAYKIVTYGAGTPETNRYLDSLGRERQSSVTNFAGTDFVNVKTDYDQRGNTTFVSQPYDISAGESASIGTRYLSFDALNRLQSKEIDQANGAIFLTSYTYNGLTTSISAGGLPPMSRTYNGLQQLVETVDAIGGVTRYAFDGAGNPIVLQDAMGNSITAGFNALGHKQWVIDPNMGVKDYTYSALGEVLTSTDANNDVIEMRYDVLGRMTDRLVNDELVGKWVFDNTDTYKGLGLLDFEDSQFAADGSRLQKFYYYRANGSSRKDLLQVTHRIYENSDQNDFDEFNTQTFTDSFYARPKGLRYPGSTSGAPDGAALAFEYNTAGFVIKERDPVSGIEYREISSRDSRGQVKAAQLADHGNGFQYDYVANYFPASGQMDDITVTDNGVTLHRLTYDYDSFGNLKDRTTSYEVGAVETLDYDDLHRLTRSTRTVGGNALPDVTYSYDALGNLLSKSDMAADYRYDNTQPNQLSSIRSASGTVIKSFSYDLSGNLTGNGGQSLVYNAFNKPVRIQEITGAPSELSYGASTLRYRQVKASGETVYYLDKLMEIESLGSAINYRHYISDVAILTKTGDLGDPNPSIDYIHRDRLGSIVNITDHTGIVEEGRGFDAFGKPRNGDWSDKATPIIGSSITDRGFTEHEHLDQHQLIHMNGRGYDYNLGRFLSIDPIIQSPGNSQSLNPYSYIMNNPLSGTDPSGYCVASVGSRIRNCVDVKVTSVDAESKEQVTKTISVNSRNPEAAYRQKYAAVKSTSESNGIKQINSIQISGSGGSGANGTDSGISNINSLQQQSGLPSRRGDKGGDSQTDAPSDRGVSSVMTTDKQGEELLQRFLDGSGEPLITDGGEWGEYLHANELLTAQVNSKLLRDAIGNKSSGAVDLTFHAEIENGYSTGYEMLHGTHSGLGDFRIEGTRTVFENSLTRYDVRLTWNDRIDPNFGYIGDIARTVVVETIYDPVPYNVHISWSMTRFFGGK